MRCSKHRLIGCPLGPVELLVYPNLKTAADFHVRTNMAANNGRSWLQGAADKHVFYEQHPELQHPKTSTEGALYRCLRWSPLRVWNCLTLQNNRIWKAEKVGRVEGCEESTCCVLEDSDDRLKRLKKPS